MNKKGFSLIEIMLVVIIIGIIIAMVAPNLSGRSEQARITAAKTDVEANLATALELYELDNGKFPSTEQGLAALLTEPTSSPAPMNWSGPYLKKKSVPNDPWQKDYIYVSPGVKNPKGFDLSSYGPDGVQSDDDITNWAE